MTDDALALAAARHCLGLETADTLRALGVQLLSAGNDDALPLAIADGASAAEITPILSQLCARRGIPQPTILEARRTFTRAALRDIAEGNAAPEPTLALVIRRVEPWQDDDDPSSYVGESWGLHHLVGAYWSYDDLHEGAAFIDGTTGTAAISLLDEQVVKLAREWLEAHPAD